MNGREQKDRSMEIFFGLILFIGGLCVLASGDDRQAPKDVPYTSYDNAELNRMLKEAEKNEDYEKAIAIRDTINSRKRLNAG